MQIDINYSPSYALAIVKLGQNEQIKAEGGAMVSRTSNVTMQTHRSAQKKGIWKALKASVLGGESFWMNTFSSENGEGEVTLAPTLPGDIKVLDVKGTVYLQSTAFLAGSPSLDIDTQFQGLKGFFSGESLFFLKISGHGPLLIASYGGIEELDIQDHFIVDTGHIVAFEEGLTYEISRFGGWKSFFLGGEGFVCHFSGKGKIWIQSRNVPGLSQWLSQKLPPKKQ